MALTAQAPAPATWARWPQHHPNTDYVVLDSGMMPYEPRQYEPRPDSVPPLQRPALASSYYTSAPLGPSAITSVSAPQYQPSVSYAGYHSFTPSPILGPVFKHEPQQYQERPQVQAMPAEPDYPAPLRTSHYLKERRESTEERRSPPVKTESHSCGSSSSSYSSGWTMQRPLPNITSVPGAPAIPASQAPGNKTGIDTLMRALQSKADTDAILRKVERNASVSEDEAKIQLAQLNEALGIKEQRKLFHCDITGCSKSFFQKTHLDIHKRAHTGDKPYTCKVPGCGLRFSQLGNLKTHERRHTGDKPYDCPQCGKRFAQRGNVRAHLKTHSQTKPFICKLDSCNKTFTQLGNLKSHQNKFHVDTLAFLTSKFASVEGYNSASPEEKELWEYFATLYKNCNKGIKGRGKHRRVLAKVAPLPVTGANTPPNTSPAPSLPPQFPVTLCHGLPQLHTPPPTHPGLPFHGVSHPASYSMVKGPNLLLNITRDSHTNYDVFDTEEGSVTSSVPASSTSGPSYDEDHGRDLAFGDRLY